MLRYLAFSFCFLPLSVAAQPEDKPPPSVELTPEAITKKLKSLDQKTDLDAKTKKKLRARYEDALTKLKEAEKSKAAAERYLQALTKAETDEAQMREELENEDNAPPVERTDNLSLSQMQIRLNQALENLNRNRAALNKELQEPVRRDRRIKAIPQELSDAQEQLATVTRELKDAEKANGAQGLADRTFHAASQLAIQAKIDQLEQERDAYAATVTQLPLRRTLATRRVFAAAKEVRMWRDVLAKQRLQELNARIARARQLLKEAPAALKPTAQENLELTERSKARRLQFDEVHRELEEVKKVLDNVQDKRRRAEQMISDLGLTDVVGKLLLSERTALPSTRAWLQDSEARHTEIQNLRVELFQLEEKRRAQDDPTTAKLIDAHPDEAEFYLELNQRYLDELITDSTTCLYELVELEATERRLGEEVRDFTRYINQHVLWIASAEPVSLKHVQAVPDAIFWFFDQNQWVGVGRALGEDVSENWWAWVLALSACATLLVLSRHMTGSLLEVGARVEQRKYHDFWPTIRALFLTMLIALVLPLPVLLLGWRLSVSHEETKLARALGGGLLLAGRVFLFLMLVRHVHRAKGLAGAHFGWTDTDLGKLRRYVRLLALVVVPLTIVAGIMKSQDNQLWHHSLGRLCFIASMLILAMFAHRLLRPGSGLLYKLSVARDAEWITRFRYLWYLGGVGAPIVIASLATIGYYYSAWQLTVRLEATVWLIFGMLLANSLLLRWIMIARRWLALHQSRRRNEKPDADNRTPSAVSPHQPTVPVVDLGQINVQTRNLLLTGIAVCGLLGGWLIWNEIFPAVTFLDRVKVWSRANPAGSFVTLFDLIIAALIIVISILVVKNLPGLSQLALPERFHVDSSLRFTITTIARYVLVATAVLLVSDRMGLSWSSVQWLVAALMIGLGFGLQEIFANFVSGLILLVERPIRVGDLVTVGDINGEVTRIQLRATTIRDWNKRELIVPNKQLVTDKLVNWSLTDSMYRVDLRVGIAYGSDTDLARQILLQIAKEHAHILEKPSPKAIFKKFGVSSLEFELRICIPHMDYWPRVVTEVNQAIDRRFREAGIVIAYPQQDIHIRTIPHTTAEDQVLETTHNDRQA